jgi:Ca-activated chloride channel family protein
MKILARRKTPSPRAPHGFARWLLGTMVVSMLVACGGASGGAPSWLGSAANDTPPAPSPTGGELVAATPPPDVAPMPASDAPAGAAATQAKSLAAFPVFTEPGELPSLVVATPGKPRSESERLPLKQTRVRARLSGFVADVEVTQRYENPSAQAIEAVYVFPLPENAAVDQMRMTVGGRTIEAKIDERNAARRTYERAKGLGMSAALLEQERPNVFTQSVANIPPKEAIEVTSHYVQDLSYDAGIYEFVFPMVVGPRFIQGAPTDRPDSGTGTKRDTFVVPDASRITPAYVGKGERSGHDISIEIVTEPGLAIGDYAAITHAVDVKTDGEGLVHLALSPKDSVPNRDFVLRYRVAGERPRGAMLVSGEDQGFFSLTIEPPDLDVDQLVGRREIVFVVDVSGSMNGVPIALCQQAMRTAIGKLRPVDTFNVITFAGRTAQLFPSARPANDVSIREALDFVDKMRAGGSTMMMDAVAAALTPDVGEGRNRYVFFMTDGYVGIEDQITRATRSFVSGLEAKGMKARVFGFGVGSSPNRALLDVLAREGKGLTVYATGREHPGRAVNQFYRYIDRSVLRDVSVDWGGMQVSDLQPGELPDLFASHPLTIHGRFKGKPSRPPIVHATSAAGPLELSVQVLPPRGGERRVLGTLWARSKVAWLEGDLASGDPRAQAEITRLGVDFGLVTRFTSFVAVDTSRSVGDGTPTRVTQPAESPADVDVKKAGGQTVTGSGDSGGADTDPNQQVRPDREEAPTDYGPMPSAPPAAEYSKRGCACKSAPGADDARSGVLALLALTLAIGVRFARRRRG